MYAALSTNAKKRMSLLIMLWEDLKDRPTTPVPAKMSQKLFEFGACTLTSEPISESRLIFDPMYLI